MHNTTVLTQIPRLFDCLYQEKNLHSTCLTELRDALRPSQIASKAWLLQEISTVIKPSHRVCVLGSWLGFLASCLYDMGIVQITDIDIDPRLQSLSESLNSRNSHYQRQTCDAGSVNLHHFDVIINTSAEHMNLDWFHRAQHNQLIVLQTNDIAIDQHVNSVESLAQAQSLYPMAYIFVGQQQFHSYTRFMLIGFKI